MYESGMSTQVVRTSRTAVQSWSMAEYMNMDRPRNIPVRPGGEPKPVVARLVRLDGTEEYVPGRSVRYAGQSHIMVAVGNPTEYFWLRSEDVTNDRQ